MMRFALVLLAAAALPAQARNWQVAIESLACEPGGTVMSVGTRIRYLGPKALVEVPILRLVGADGAKPLAPRSLAWRSGSKPLAALLVAGGVRTLGSGEEAVVRLRFDVGDAAGPLQFEVGDVPAFPLTRQGRACASLLKAPPVPARRAAGKAPAQAPKLRVYRDAYPCRQAAGGLRVIEANHPPYLPAQLLVLGRSYLPNARHVELPMGRAPAQAYLYTGPDTLDAIEQAALRFIGADFPAFLAGNAFAFNWGEHRGATGNQIDSIGLYALRACPNPRATTE
jgi:hypothetical protein